MRKNKQLFDKSKSQKKDAFNVLDIVEESINKDFCIPDSISVDDSDMPLAPNFYTWVRSPNFMKQSMFPRHIQIGMHLFNDFCPLCSNPRYVNNLFNQDEKEILDNIVFLVNGVCPECGISRAQLIQGGKFPAYYDELAGVAGQRSSKTSFTAMLATYVLHRYIKLPAGSPSKFFNMPSTVLHMTFTAITYEQAKDTIWQWFKDYVDDSPWFKEYFELLKHYELKLSTRLFANKDTFLAFRDKKLLCYPATPDKRKLRGRTRFFFAIDEFSYFNASDTSKSVKFNAAEIYAALRNSLQTLKSAIRRKRELGYYDLPSAYSVLVSSPVAKTDKLMQMLRKADRVKTRYAFHYPTWEFNPDITFEDLKSEFEENPIIAARDFGADPPLNDAPLISNKRVIQRAFRKRKQIVKTIQVFNEEMSTTTIRVKIPRMRKYLGYDKGASRRVLTLDAGLTNNSFAASVAHTFKGKLVVDAFIEIIPMRGCSVNFTLVERKVLPPLIAYFEPVVVAADRWQSEHILSNLQADYDCIAEALTYSVSYNDIQFLKQLILEQKASFPQTEVPFKEIADANFDYPSFFLNKPVSHFAYQLLTVRDTGRRVEKGFKSTDDLFRAVALASAILHDETLMEELSSGFDTDDVDEHEAQAGGLDKFGVVYGRDVFSKGADIAPKTNTNVGVVVMPRGF